MDMDFQQPGQIGIEHECHVFIKPGKDRAAKTRITRKPDKVRTVMDLHFFGVIIGFFSGCNYL